VPYPAGARGAVGGEEHNKSGCIQRAKWGPPGLNFTSANPSGRLFTDLLSCFRCPASCWVQLVFLL